MRADFSRRILKITAAAGVAMLFWAGRVPESSAFSLSFKRKASASHEPAKKMFTSEAENYFIFFSVEDPGNVKNDGGEAVMLDLSYKIVDRNGNLQSFLNDAQGGKIRFLDSDGFAVVESALLTEDLVRADHYGSVKIDGARVRRLSTADIVPLKPEVVEALRKQREEAAAAVRAEEEKRAVAAAKEQAAVSEPQPEQAPSPEAPPAETEQEESFELGGVTNEDVQKVLEEFENQKPTLVEPSKDSIDLKAEASKEENV